MYDIINVGWYDKCNLLHKLNVGDMEFFSL